MNLYEIRTGIIGESYVRAYVWANDEYEAGGLFAKTNPGHKIQEVRQLLRSTDKPFCTVVDDQGWEII